MKSLSYGDTASISSVITTPQWVELTRNIVKRKCYWPCNRWRPKQGTIVPGYPSQLDSGKRVQQPEEGEGGMKTVGGMQ